MTALVLQSMKTFYSLLVDKALLGSNSAHQTPGWLSYWRRWRTMRQHGESSLKRTVVRKLDGGCDVPIASFAVTEGDRLWLRARVGSPDGANVIAAEARGRDPEALGLEVAEALLEMGAAEILTAARS